MAELYLLHMDFNLFSFEISVNCYAIVSLIKEVCTPGYVVKCRYMVVIIIILLDFAGMSHQKAMHIILLAEIDNFVKTLTDIFSFAVRILML